MKSVVDIKSAVGIKIHDYFWIGSYKLSLIRWMIYLAVIDSSIRVKSKEKETINLN